MSAGAACRHGAGPQAADMPDEPMAALEHRRAVRAGRTDGVGMKPEPGCARRAPASRLVVRSGGRGHHSAHAANREPPAPCARLQESPSLRQRDSAADSAADSVPPDPGAYKHRDCDSPYASAPHSLLPA